MPKHHACPRHLELDLYSGCPFGCLYCVERARQSPESRPTGAETELSSRIAALPAPWPVYLSPCTDAYQPLEARESRVPPVLRLLAQRRHPCFVITKSPLVLRDADFFAGRTDAFIAVSLNSLDDGFAARLEPETPSPSSRRELVETLLARADIRVIVKIDPILPGLGDGPRLETLLAWLCRVRPFAVTAETARLDLPMLDRIATALSAAEASRLRAAYPDPGSTVRHPDTAYRLALFRDIAAVLEAAGVRTAFCAATLPEAITPHDCRGGFT